MTATLASIGNKTTKVKRPKVKRPREDRFCVFLLFFFQVLFCGGSYFFMFLSSLKRGTIRFSPF
jgi:hypothetical protein